MLKTFFDQFCDPYFFKQIQIDVKECQTINDLKKKIAYFFHIDDYRKLTIDNLPNECLLEKITEKFIFTLKFPGRCTNITFSFPNHLQIVIKNGYRMTYSQVIKYFQNYQLYYSNECISKYFHFKIFKEELPQIEFPFLAIPSDVWVYIEISCNVISLNYGSKKFFFSENELASEAYNLIKEIYVGCDSVVIQSHGLVLNYSDSLKKADSYIISVNYKIIFKIIEKLAEFSLNLDFLSKVSDARKQLFEKYFKDYISSQNDIIIYDGNMQIVDDYSKLLKNIQHFDNYFYFDFKKKSLKSDSNMKFIDKIIAENDLKFKYYPKTPDIKPKNDFNQYQISQQKYIFDYKSPKRKPMSNTSKSIYNQKNDVFSSPIEKNSNRESKNSYIPLSPEKDQKYSFDYKSPRSKPKSSNDSNNNNLKYLPSSLKIKSKQQNQKIEFKNDDELKSSELSKNYSEASQLENETKEDFNYDGGDDYDDFFDDDFQFNLNSNEKEELNQQLSNSKSNPNEQLQIIEEEEEYPDGNNYSNNSNVDKNDFTIDEIELNSNEAVKKENTDLNEVKDSSNSDILTLNEDDDSLNSNQIVNEIFHFLEEEE